MRQHGQPGRGRRNRNVPRALQRCAAHGETIDPTAEQPLGRQHPMSSGALIPGAGAGTGLSKKDSTQMNADQQGCTRMARVRHAAARPTGPSRRTSECAPWRCGAAPAHGPSVCHPRLSLFICVQHLLAVRRERPGKNRQDPMQREPCAGPAAGGESTPTRHCLDKRATRRSRDRGTSISRRLPPNKPFGRQHPMSSGALIPGAGAERVYARKTQRRMNADQQGNAQTRMARVRHAAARPSGRARRNRNVPRGATALRPPMAHPCSSPLIAVHLCSTLSLRVRRAARKKQARPHAT